ncbi:hypothetical protein JXO59_00135 [candidate division KSB1 bacterium]|nr:hypothetical protein [candidate division KSB1 bacterium]
MKKAALILSSVFLILFQCQSGNSQQVKPEKVYRIVYEIKSNEWYQEQARLWKQELDRDPNNAEAWYNYYNANRYARFEALETAEKQARLGKIIEDMGQAIPDTYEYHLLSFWNSHKPEDISELEKAYALRPERPDPYYGFITHYSLKQKPEKVREFYEKLYTSRDIAPWLLNYNYNMLMSLEENAVLITNGDNDTYPAEMLQQVKGIRPDVSILNLSMSPNEGYLSDKLAGKKVKLNHKELLKKGKTAGDVKRFSPALFIQALCRQLAAEYPEIPVYFAVTVYEGTIKPLKQDLYITGLALRYSPERLDNLALLKKNLETRFLLDFLQNDWYCEYEIGKNLRAQMHLNYIAPMLMLSDHYQKGGDVEQANKWKMLAETLADNAGRKELLESYKK